MEKIHLKQAVVVEGKYDKIKLSSIIDALIIETHGFGIYKDKEKIALIKAVSEKNGVIIVTDSDVAGFKLRGFVRSIAKDATVTNLYIPQIEGKEKRKQSPSKQGLLGVEGINADVLRGLFKRFVTDEKAPDRQKITKLDFYEDGFSGDENSAVKRQALLKKLNLPCYIGANGLIEIINSLMTYEEYKLFINTIREEN